ncbi:MAG TPA: P-loop NTPase [Candidatus Nanoarchaeia archaeon]|nr:P-loop NTPase [Candidatus Nanoarchaeia archaeon]
MTKFVAVVSGKGGVGKTTSTLNIGQALTDLGKKVLLLDANLVTPNLAIQLGFMDPKGTINKFLRKEKSLKEITYLHESGISLIPASPSYNEFQKTNSQNLSKIFKHLENTADFVIIDSPSGLGYEVHQVLKNSDEVLVVVNPNLSSVVDALKTIQIAKENDAVVAGVILNMTNKGRNEMKPDEIAEIIGHPIVADIRYDKKFRKSLHLKVPLTHKYSRSRSAREFYKIAEHLCHDII